MQIGRKYDGGFTLTEIFVVMANLAILGTMGWVASGVVNNRQMTKTAELQVAQMEVGMNGYRMDFGDVIPAGVGDEWSSHILYGALYCDEDGDGQPDVDEQTNETRVPYCESIVPLAKPKQQREAINGIPAIKKSVRVTGLKRNRKAFVIFDPWGNPYRYRQGYELPNKDGKTGKGINPDFDIFTQGPDGKGNGLTNRDANEDNISNIRSWK